MIMSLPHEQMNNVASTVMKSCEDIGTMARDHMDATMKSASALSEGWSEIARNAQAHLQDSFSRSVSASKTMMSARTLPEITDMQQELMKDMFDSWVTLMGKMSQISARLSQSAMSPLTEHATNTMGMITQKMRAAA